MLRTTLLAVALLGLAACGSEQTAEEPLNLPQKENTWVRTEKVEITKDAVLAGMPTDAPPIPINEALQKKTDHGESSGESTLGGGRCILPGPFGTSGQTAHRGAEAGRFVARV